MSSVFSSENHSDNHSFELGDLADRRVWLTWRNELRGDKRTKVPYRGSGQHAKSDDPTTWIGIEPAAELARKIVNGSGGGIGIVLGIDCGDGWRLGGVDLDTCLSRCSIDGGVAYERIDPWAQEVVDRINSYTEVSPSLTGLKIFFRYRQDDLAKLRALMGTDYGKMFKRPGKGHPPAIEFHLGNRYFAVTGDVPDGFPKLIRAVELEDLAWVVGEAGPRFVRQDQSPDSLSKTGDCSAEHDQSRSGIAFRKVKQLRRTGKIRSYLDMRSALLDDPETTEWVNEKGLASNERELKRLWENTRPVAESIDDRLADMAATFAAEQADFATIPDRKRKFRSRAEDKAAPAPKWLIEGLIPENADVAIYAPMAYLKSFVAVDLAYAVATGLKALGALSVVETGPVFYFAGEGYYDLAKKRGVAWEIERGYQPYEVADIWFGNGAPITTDDVLIEDDIREIEALLGERRAKLFVIDTLNRALNGQDEDKSHVAARYLNTVKKIRDRVGGTSLTIGHMGKDAERGERGSSAFAAGFDTVIWIEKCRKDEDTGTHTIQLYVRKQKDAEDGQRYWLRSKPVSTDDGDSLVLVPCGEEEGRAALADKNATGLGAEDVRAALRELTPKGGHVGTSQLARQIATMTGRSEHSVVTALSRNRGERQKFRPFVMGDPRNAQWCLPGRHMEGMETLDEMIESLAEDRALAAQVTSQSVTVFDRDQRPSSNGHSHTYPL